MTYKTKGTCSSQIDFDLKDGKVYNVRFTGGCNGNLKGIGALVEGQDARDVINRLEGTTCGFKSTSCPDQLAKALKEALNQESENISCSLHIRNTMPLSKGRHNRQISARHADLLTGALFIFDTAVRKTICPTYHKDY